MKSIPSNYGYVFFWYGYPDNEALENYYAAYVSRKSLKEIEKARKEDEEDTFQVQDYLEDCLFSIARDHSDILGSSWAEVYLAILMSDLEKKGAEEGASLLKEFVKKKLERLEKFMKDCFEEKTVLVQNVESNFEVVDFLSLKELNRLADEEFWECDCDYRELAKTKMGCQIRLKIDFGADDTLKEVVGRIDVAVTPLKGLVDQMFRWGESYYPF